MLLKGERDKPFFALSIENDFLHFYHNLKVLRKYEEISNKLIFYDR